MPHHAADALAELPLGRTAPEAEAASVNDLNLDRGERQAIEQAVKKHAFNISTAGTELELSRGTPYRRMGKHAFKRRVAVRRASHVVLLVAPGIASLLAASDYRTEEAQSHKHRGDR